jgi:hypothetical protein
MKAAGKPRPLDLISVLPMYGAAEKEDRMSSIGPTDALGLCQAARRSLQMGMLDEAIGYLQRAVGMDARSQEAYELLGIAYSQKGLFNEGIQAFQMAVNLNPTKAATRVNLGVALQRAGRLQEAARELTEALRLDPANEKARQALNIVNSQVPRQPAAPQQTAYAVPPQPYSQPVTYAPPPGYGQPYGPPPGYGQQAYGPPPGYAPLPGYGQAPGYGQYPGYGAPGYGAYAPNPYAQQAYVGPDNGGWSMENFMRVLSEPARFMSEQRGQTAYGPPIAFFLVNISLAMVIGMIVGLFVQADKLSTLSPGGVVFMIVLLLVYFVIALAIMLGFQFVAAGILHMFVMMFGGKGGYIGTFRASVYASVPSVVVGCVAMLLSLFIHEDLVIGLVQLIGLIWFLVVLIIGVREIHWVSSGAASAAVLIPSAIGFILMTVILYPVFEEARQRARMGIPSGPTFPNNFPTGPPNFPRGPYGSGGGPPGFQ